LAGTVRPGPAGALWALLTGSIRPPVLTGRVGARATVPGTAWAALPRLVGTWAALAGTVRASGLASAVRPTGLTGRVGT